MADTKPKKRKRPHIGPYTRIGPMRQFSLWLYAGDEDFEGNRLSDAEHLKNMREIARFWYSVKNITLAQREKLLASVDAAEETEAA